MGTIGGTGDDRSASTAIDASGNVYQIGKFSGTVDFDPGPNTFNVTAYGGTDVYITKIGANGEFIWVKRLGGTDNDLASGIAIDSSGNVITVGTFKSSAYFNPADSTTAILTAPAPTGTNQIFVSKLDSDGNYIWAKNFGCACGGFNNNANAVSVDPASGAVYTVGSVPQSTDFDPGPASDTKTLGGNYDYFLQKLNSSGVYEWAFTIGAGGNDSPADVSVTSSGDVLLTGFAAGPNTINFNKLGTATSLALGTNGYTVARYSPTGILRWVKAIGTGLLSVREDLSNNIIIGGNLSGGTDIDFDPDTGTAYLNSTNGLGFILKLNSSGAFSWVKQIFGAPQYINVDGNSIFATGFFSGTGDFDPGAGVITLTSTYSSGVTYSNDLFALKLDASGNALWAKSLGGTGDIQTTGLVINTAHNIFITGNFTLVADFGPSPCVLNFTSKGSWDNYFLALDPNGSQLAPPSPTFSSLSVTTGPISGGTSSRFIGTNLLCTIAVTVNGNAASFSVVSDTSVAFTTPIGTVGAKNVVISTPFESLTSTTTFLYYELISSFSAFSVAGSVSTVSYRTPIVITATVAYASRITFKYANIRIGGCVSKLTASSAPFTATCTWRPSQRGAGLLTAVAVPIAGGISSGVAVPINISVGGRSGTR
jgi:hypothetical protein